MPDSNSSVSDVNPQDDQQKMQPAVNNPAPRIKEQESSYEDEKKVMVEIKSRAEKLDSEAILKIQESLGEAKLAQPEVKVPPDVEDAGVYSPSAKAGEVVSGGSTIELQTSENIYQKGLHTKIVGHVVDKVVVGVSSVAALAFWVGRLIKMAHKHAMRIVFRKGGDK